MRRLEMSWVIHRPPEDVWKFVTNFDNWAKASISKGEWVRNPAGPTELGTTVETSRKMLGRKRHIHSYVVTEFEPYRAFGMTDKVPGMRRMNQRFTFEPSPEGTRVTRTADLDLGRGQLLEPALRWLVGRTWPIETRGMTRLIEAG
jgi:carbon monoxide dehydrogenase subunit G